MSLYIRHVPLYENLLLLYGLLLLLDIICPLLSKLAKTTTVSYLSSKQKPDGLRWSFPFTFEPNRLHYVKRKPNIVSLVLYGLLIFVSSLTLAFSCLECDGFEVLFYAFWSTLQLLLSVTMWHKELKLCLSLYKHKEHLLVIEVCQCANDAFKSILLLEGYHGEHYTYVVPNIENWVVGNYHVADCLGSYVEELQQEPVEPCKVIWVGVGDKTTHASWNNLLMPIFAFTLGACAIAIPNVSIRVFGATMVLLGLFILIPRRRTRNLKPFKMERTECFDDLPQITDYTYIFINKNGKPFYYLCDDPKAIRITGTYVCETVGNRVEIVGRRLEKDSNAVYHKPEKLGTGWVSIPLLLATMLCFEYIGLWFVNIPASILLAFVIIGILRYKLKGDI